MTTIRLRACVAVLSDAGLLLVPHFDTDAGPLQWHLPGGGVVFCDAAAYDAGYLPPEAIARRVQVRGRGGTILQPAIDLLEHAPDFPADGPLLIITDGQCDRLQVRRPTPFCCRRGATCRLCRAGRCSSSRSSAQHSKTNDSRPMR